MAPSNSQNYRNEDIEVVQSAERGKGWGGGELE